MASPTRRRRLPTPSTGSAHRWSTSRLGDSWTHLIEVLDLRPSAGHEPAARLIGGQRRAPLEDSGGAYGYMEILTTLIDPTNENHDQVRSWVDGSIGPWNPPFDPESLDVERPINFSRSG